MIIDVSDPALLPLLGLLLLCMVLSAFFSGTETALMSFNRYQLRTLAKGGHRGAILAERLGGVRVRSDVERKRLAGIDWRSAAASAPQLYSAEMTARTYARLQQVADAALSAGVPVVVDAASLRAHERRALIGLAKSSHVGGVTVECTAPLDILRHRVAQRAERGVDPSDATVAVLESQLQWREPASADESAHWMQMDTAAAEATQRAACDAVLARLGA
jgi:predicted kinase